MAQRFTFFSYVCWCFLTTTGEMYEHVVCVW
jgi:hypothetical protein